jgi:hypothetical protein
MKNRQGSYKKVLLTEASMKPSGEYLQKNIEILTKLPLSTYDFCTLYILLFLRIRHPKNWLQKKNSLKIASDTHSNLLDLIPLEFDLNEWEKEKLKDVSTHSLFTSFSLRGIPMAVNRTMINWGSGIWNIALFTYIPSPRELLRLQVKKTRCITLTIAKDEIDQLVLSSRDPLSFVLHDLLHADHFFNQEESLKGQLGFYSLINKVYDRAELKKSLKEDSQFKNDFEYVVSDMNAYVIHLLKCLKSAFTRLDSNLAEPLFPKLLQWWDMPMEVSLAASKLNTPEFSFEDEIYLKDFFERHQEMTV